MVTFEPAVGQGKDNVSSMPFFTIFLTFYFAGLLLCALDLVDGVIYYADIDDQMRAMQIRSLMSSSGSWWNLNLPMIASPEPYFSPWSRLVDLPYVAIASGLSPLMGQDSALSFAFQIWPPILLGVYCFLAASVCQRFSPASTHVDRLLLVVTAIWMVFSIWEFVPGRIDHHNVQLVALLAIYAGLSRWDRRGGIMIGLGSMISVAVALEGIPFVAVAFGGLVAAVLSGHRQAVVVLRAAGFSILICTVPLALLLIGPGGITSTQCDAFSAPYLVLLMGCAAALVMFTLLAERGAVWRALVVSAAMAVLLALVFVWLFPGCLAGPYWMIDPVSKAYWFDRIPQESSSLYYFQERQFAPIAFEALMACILVMAAPSTWKAFKAGRLDLVMMWVFSAFSLFLAIVLGRYLRFAFAFTPLLLPLVHEVLRPASRAGIRSLGRDGLLIAFGLGFVVVSIGATAVMARPREIYFDAPTYMSFDTCKTGDFSALSEISAGRIVAPEGLSVTLLPLLPSGLSVAAVPFHRAAPGMRRTFDAFMSEDPAVRRNALAPFDYVAICRFPLKTETGTAPLYDALSGGKDWPGLIRLPTGADNPFQLFRIDHAALQ